MHMQDFYKEEEIWTERKIEVFSKINQAGLPLVLFGKTTAVNGTFLCQIKVPVCVICDNDPTKWGTHLWGLEVISPSQLGEIYPAYNVLILVPFEHQIIPQLEKLPIPPAEIFRLDLYFEGSRTATYYEKVRGDLEDICCCLADQESRDTYEAVIRYRLNRDPAILNPVALPREKQYFPASLGGKPFLGTEEVFVDAGAFIGDTVEAFCSAVHGRYSAIHAIEPDRRNYKQLLETAKEFSNISCYWSAVGDETGTLRFSSDDSSSRADGTGEEIISVNPLEQLLKNVPVTYLKMDVEGMECAALRGAKTLIQTFRPKLAICTYHSDADML